jgi:hypothetical protein
MPRVIGEFGSAAAEARQDDEPATVYLGPDKDEFYVNSDVGFTPFGMLAQAHASGKTEDHSAATMAFLTEIVAANPVTERTAAQELERFKESTIRQHVKQDALMEMINAVLADESGKAQEPSGGSSDGQSGTATSASSKRKSSGQGSESKPRFEPVTADTLRELSG